MTGPAKCEDCQSNLAALNPSTLGFKRLGLPLVHCPICDCLTVMAAPGHRPPKDLARPPAWM